ncbi:unnamed protein product [Protopolystoma xenopodis]|uniref:Serine/threonine-protein phosphatase n=1 Tax=Protopolystoma xenopodis TaxID=117903 RepID=A0A448X4S6_9PLAT|nr:unnamed protein product [Protopolystoma xenopodis]
MYKLYNRIPTPDEEYASKFIFNRDETITIDVDSIVTTLLNGIPEGQMHINIEETAVMAVALSARKIFEEESIVLDLKPPLTVCGDIHGQFYDLLRIFKLGGQPPETRYLFLGDYVDRGIWSLEVLMLLLCYKLKYPSDVFLLRGNHESSVLNRIYGFRREVRSRFGSSRCWRSMVNLFGYLPIAAIIERRIFCCHGGISPELLSSSSSNIIDVLGRIKRPTEIPRYGVLCDLLWSDPLDIMPDGEQPKGWLPNDRGCSWAFGIDVVDKFLEKYNLDLIVRAHQVVEDGYEFVFNRRLVTIFSAPNYLGTFGNAGGIFRVKYADEQSESEQECQLCGSFQILLPEFGVNQWQERSKT